MARPIGIRVFRGDEQIDVQIFDRDIIKIGRLASAHLRLDDPKVSRIHAVIDIAAGTNEVSIIDMGSSEGTRVSGESVSRSKLNNSDEITLGDSRLVVLLEQDAIAALVSEHAALVDEGFELEPEGATEPRDPTRAGDLQVDSAIREALAELEVPDQSSVFEAQSLQEQMVQEEDDAEASLSGAFFRDEVPAAKPEPRAPAPEPAAPILQPPRENTAPSARAPAAVAPPATAMAPAAPAAVLPPIPEDEIRADNRFLEASLEWSGDVMQLERLREEETLTIGSLESDTFFVPVEDVALASSFELATRTPNSSDWSVRFTQKMAGTVTRGGQTIPLSSAGGMPDGDAYVLPLNDDMEVRIDVGHFTMNLKAVSKSRAIPLPAILDTLFLNTALATMFVTISALAFLLLFPVDTDGLDDDLLTNNSKFQTLILKKKEPDKSLIDRLKGKKAEGTAAKKDRGKMGKKKEKNKDGRATFKKKDKPSDEQVVSSKMQQLFGGKNGGVAAIFGAESGGSELQTLLGNMSGSSAAAAAGEGGLSFRGSGPGGGGTGDGTIGLGSVGTRGRGSGDSGYGSGEGGIGKKRDKNVRVSTGNPIIYGSLDKEIIRRIVREHQGEIRYCYTKELARDPGLGGKISMKWVISGTGRVAKANVAESQMKSKAVERCLASRIRRWKFPEPKGGGIVVVTYPFVFKKGG